MSFLNYGRVNAFVKGLKTVTVFGMAWWDLSFARTPVPTSLLTNSLPMFWGL